ncbi:hypothetical protein DITRI_Ditri12bG0175100 [Diplodiscus trichospermus]
MKTLMRPGGGELNPSDGDQVAKIFLYFLCFKCSLYTVRTLDGVVVQSTRSEYGGEYTVVCDDLGVLKKVIDEGQGWESPREPYEVKAWISAKTGDGKLILSHMEGEPYFLTFGKDEVPKCLEMGIGTMSRKEKVVIYVTNNYLTPSPLLPVIEGYEELHFEVELVHFIQVSHCSHIDVALSLCNQIGSWEFPMDFPLHDSLLRVHYKGILLNKENTVFYDTRVDNQGEPLEFSSGEGLVTCPPDYAYDKFSRPVNVPEGAHVQWEIENLGFEMPRDRTGLNFLSIMDEAEKIRVTGNRLFKEGKFELAKAKYEKVLREFNHVNPQTDEEGKVFLDTRNLLHLNVAACFLKMGECRKSIEACNKVLDATPVHVKALYSRGMAHMAAGDFEEARSDFKMMIKVDKSSERDATAALAKLKKQEQEVERKTRKQFKGLFDKKPGEIAEVEDRTGDEISGGNQKKTEESSSE